VELVHRAEPFDKDRAAAAAGNGGPGAYRRARAARGICSDQIIAFGLRHAGPGRDSSRPVIATKQPVVLRIHLEPNPCVPADTWVMSGWPGQVGDPGGLGPRRRRRWAYRIFRRGGYSSHGMARSCRNSQTREGLRTATGGFAHPVRAGIRSSTRTKRRASMGRSWPAWHRG